jgi:peptide/nickel transport system substrate-binding protein
MVAGLPYDGLVAYRRVPGVAGEPSSARWPRGRRGRARTGAPYVFTLRRGIRYSDGTPIRPGDFRASVKRHLGAPSYAAFPPYFSGIVGARRCIRAGTRCDLSQGIESDGHARTITIHLTAPDPEFLHKLTLPMAYVVPSGTPAHADDPGFTPPGTGPYRIASWNVHHGGVLVRNPHFRPTAARPAGLPNRIEIKVTPLGRIETHTAAIERGNSDLTWLMDFPLRGHLPDLLARTPGRLHSAPWPGGTWMFLNVRRPPFDDPRVRQALNFAVDRAKLVELYGGPQAADLTCQLVTPGYPGHSPYCPYTADPTPGGGWTAPDLDRARRLVAASGRAGARVTVTPAWTRAGAPVPTSCLCCTTSASTRGCTCSQPAPTTSRRSSGGTRASRWGCTAGARTT